VLVVVTSALAAFSSSNTGDYGAPSCSRYRCDDAAPALHGAVTGDIGALVHHQPIMGMGSVLVRLPAVAAAHAGGGDLTDEYKAGAFVCLTIAGLLALWIASAAIELGASRAQGVALFALLVAATIFTRAVPFGHPEEPLAATLAVASAVAALRGQTVGAGVLLGLAVGTKEWALLAVIPVLAVTGAQWKRTGIVALAAAALLFLPYAIGDPSAFSHARSARNAKDLTATPANVWWRAGVLHPRPGHPGTGFKTAPAAVAKVARPAVLILGVGLGLLFWRRRLARPAADVLAVLGLLFLLRVVLDTQTYSYHHIPALMAIPVWEVVARKRFPVVGLLAAGALQITARLVVPHVSADAFNAIYLAWALPLVAYLAAVSFGRVRSAIPA